MKRNYYDEFLLGDFFGEFKGIYNGSANYYNIENTEDNCIINVVATGLSKEEISIEYADGILQIKGKPQQKSKFIRDFQLSFRLENVDVSRTESALEYGILTLTMPKVKPEKKVFNIKIK